MNEETKTSSNESLNDKASADALKNDSVDSNGSLKNNSFDVSKVSIAMLILLTFAISIIGTWTVLNEMSILHVSQNKQSTANQGTVQLGIVSNFQKPIQKQLSDTTGHVVLTVQK